MSECRFCPVHGDYIPQSDDTSCPACESDPVAARVSLRSVQVVTTEMPAISWPDSSQPSGPQDSTSYDPLTTIDDMAACPSCAKLVPLDKFQSEAMGEVWEGEAALWAEDGICRDCYRDVIPGKLRRWTREEWIAHHFEGWRAQVRRVHDVEVLVESEQDSWLPDASRHRILNVDATLSARREHLARSSMRLRDLRSEFDLKADPQQFTAELELARRSLSEEARSELEMRREADLSRERDRRIDSVSELSPSQVFADAGLDAEAMMGDLARETGTQREVRASDLVNVKPGPGTGRAPRWALYVLVVVFVLFIGWWFGFR